VDKSTILQQGCYAPVFQTQHAQTSPEKMGIMVTVVQNPTRTALEEALASIENGLEVWPFHRTCCYRLFDAFIQSG
jgi:O-acetylhomoserine/O-acetylserine sulfhydrylase-like pyridoxal-dependent enzyme